MMSGIAVVFLVILFAFIMLGLLEVVLHWVESLTRRYQAWTTSRQRGSAGSNGFTR